MKQMFILILKFIVCVIAFAAGLDLFFPATLVEITSFSLTLTLISYIIGDRFILPNWGNMTATIADFILTYLSIWIFGSILLNNYMQIAWGSIITGVIVAFSEMFIHRMLLAGEDPAVRNRSELLTPRMAYGTEIADEDELREEKE